MYTNSQISSGDASYYVVRVFIPLRISIVQNKADSLKVHGSFDFHMGMLDRTEKPNSQPNVGVRLLPLSSLGCVD